MKAEARPTAFDIRLYVEGSYAERSPYIFVVRANVVRDGVFLTGLASDRFTMEAWRAVRAELKRLGFRWAEWERAKLRCGQFVETVIRRKVE